MLARDLNGLAEMPGAQIQLGRRLRVLTPQRPLGLLEQKARLRKKM